MTEYGDHVTGTSLGLLDDLDQAPALGGAERTGLHDPNEIAGVGLIALVVTPFPASLCGPLKDWSVVMKLSESDFIIVFTQVSTPKPTPISTPVSGVLIRFFAPRGGNFRW